MGVQLTVRQKDLQLAGDKLHAKIVEGFLSGKHLAVVEAPPGSGKTYMLMRVVASLVSRGWKVAIATQTNTQANDLAEQFGNNPGYSSLFVVRLGSSGSIAPNGFPRSVSWITKAGEMPDRAGVFIGTAAKWATVAEPQPYNLFAIDEAWQMKWADLMRCADISDKFMMIGDPGQIPPVTSIDVARWGTSKRAPHLAAPEVVKADPQFASERVSGALPSCRRLPAEAVPFVKMFYDFDFDAFAEPAERKLLVQTQKDPEIEALLKELAESYKDQAQPGWVDGTQDEPVDKHIKQNRKLEEASSLVGDIAVASLLSKLETCEPVLATIPTSPDGPPALVDVELARAIHRVVKGLLSGPVQLVVKPGEAPRAIKQSDIGVCAAHRSMNGAIRKAFGTDFADVKIDTAERWQGLEKPVMIAVHPLSGVTEPSEFDLGTGRLCVMASRQQVALIFVARDHIGQTIESALPGAVQPPGTQDIVGRGRRAHLDFWQLLKERNRVISLV